MSKWTINIDEKHTLNDRIENIIKQLNLISKAIDLKDAIIEQDEIAISSLKEHVELRKLLDLKIKEFFESHIGDKITREMIDEIWGE